MRERVRTALAGLRKDGRKGLMPFITGGFPSLQATTETIIALGGAGATAIEVGIPFSDPIADGPVIAESMHKALSAGVDCAGVLSAVAAARRAHEVPIVAMVSASIMLRRGGGRFVTELADAGFDGIIVPDIDLAWVDSMEGECDARGLSLSLLVAATTPHARARELARHSRGFVYLLARQGITGASGGAPNIAEPVAQLRKATDLPIAAGFGISTASHVAAVCAHADAAIVGSAYVKRMAGNDAVDQAIALTRELSAGLVPRARASLGTQ